MAHSSFIGRRKELTALQDAYQSKDSAFIPVYGRRRVGKSELLLHFIKPHPAIYFLGKRAPAEEQIREFLEVAAQVLEDPLVASQPIGDWKRAIETVVSRWRGKQKLILVFDEFQWIVEKSPELPSILQELWDRTWQKTGQIFLILCGSYIGFMEREVLGKKSPLFGRRTGQILLKPFGFREAAQFHPAYSLPQKAQTYFICGGIPFYLRFFLQERSVLHNIEQTLLNEHAALYREPDFLLREELREVENYYAILMALAAGSQPSRDIARHTGIPDRSLHYYMQNLFELGYVERRYPLGGSRPAPRSVRYVLLDPLLRFWFRFIYPHSSLISQMGPQKSMAHLVKGDLDAYFGACFESLCREALPLLYEKEGVSSAFEVGQYWDKKVQIDVVGLRDDGWVDLGECKWGRVRSGQALENELQKKLSLYSNPKNATLCPRLFVQEIHGSRSSSDRVRWHTLSDLYA